MDVVIILFTAIIAYVIDGLGTRLTAIIDRRPYVRYSIYAARDRNMYKFSAG